MRTVIYGESDDLIEVSGDLSEELSPPYGTTVLLALSTGDLLEVAYTDVGFWRINPVGALGEGVEIIRARGEDEGRDEDFCPGYSDKAVIAVPLSFMLMGTDLVRGQR